MLSTGINRQIRKKVAFNTDCASVLNNAIDAEKLAYNQKTRSEIRAELGIADDAFVIGTVGRLDVAKNPDGIIEIIDSIRKKKDDFVFLWVGRGNLESEIKNKLAAKGLSDIVKMLGVRDDVDRIYQALDVFVFPSLYEGLGNVMIEAQAAGLPSFCSEFVPHEVDITELCRHISLDDYEIWADNVISANTDNRQSTYDRIVESGYDIQKNASELQEFYLKHAIRLFCNDAL